MVESSGTYKYLRILCYLIALDLLVYLSIFYNAWGAPQLWSIFYAKDLFYWYDNYSFHQQNAFFRLCNFVHGCQKNERRFKLSTVANILMYGVTITSLIRFSMISYRLINGTCLKYVYKWVIYLEKIIWSLSHHVRLNCLL